MKQRWGDSCLAAARRMSAEMRLGKLGYNSLVSCLSARDSDRMHLKQISIFLVLAAALLPGCGAPGNFSSDRITRALASSETETITVETIATAATQAPASPPPEP